MIITVQPSEYVDQIVDGHELTKMPYPFFVNELGEVGRQDFWQGDPLRVIGFQKDLALQQIDLEWGEAAVSPERAVGMYVVTADREGNYAVHDTAIRSMVVDLGKTEV